jgi:hypothetical protein
MYMERISYGPIQGTTPVFSLRNLEKVWKPQENWVMPVFDSGASWKSCTNVTPWAAMFSMFNKQVNVNQYEFAA